MMNDDVRCEWRVVMHTSSTQKAQSRLPRQHDACEPTGTLSGHGVSSSCFLCFGYGPKDFLSPQWVDVDNLDLDD
jgi:hypothetical protein